MDKRLTMFAKGLILVLIPLITQVMFLAILVKIRTDQSEAQELVLHANQVIAEADSFSASLAEMNSSVRGLVITDSPDLARRYVGAKDAVKKKLRVLEALVEDNKTQKEQVGRLAEKVDEVQRWSDGLFALIAANRRPEAFKLIKSLHGLALTDEVQDRVDEFLHIEEDLRVGRLENLDRQAWIQNAVLVVGAALAILSTALLSVLFARGIGRRLAVLTENTRRTAEGEELLPPLEGDDELSDLDRAFRTMAGALAAKSQENELFVYSVSHDLRSPLVNLQGFSQELAAGCKELRQLVDTADLPDDARRRALALLDRSMGESVRFIQTAVLRLSAIIDALLRLSRAGRVEYHLDTVDVPATVRRVVEALRATITQRGAEVVVHDMPPARADPTAVEQIFANVIGNAVNYLDPRRPGRIEVGACEPGPGTPPTLQTYYVRDNGVGIADAQLPKVFAAFQRLRPDMAKGEGIGLALVHRVVERHGGRIWVESTPDVGTTFYITLPPAADPAGDGAAPRGSETAVPA
jgi:signal transduction histidine kinase